MKILIFPDIHGRTFWYDAFINNINNVDACVFIGDYTDPYSYEGIANDMALENLHNIVSVTSHNNPDKCIMLLGNHAMHYINQVFCDYACGSRYSNFFARRYSDALLKLDFKYAHVIHTNDKDILFTHAGINKTWYIAHQESELNHEAGNAILFPQDDMLNNYNECFKDKTIADCINNINDKYEFRALCEIGRARGGWDRAGGPFWNDIHEIMFSKDNFNLPYQDNVYQIFGHTQLQDKPIITDKFACLDCRRAFVLDTDTMKFTEIKNNEQVLQED